VASGTVLPARKHLWLIRLAPAPLCLSPRHVSWLLLRPADELTPIEADYVDELLRSDAVVATIQEAGQTFFALLQGLHGDQLDAWLEQADASGVRELADLAGGIWRDGAAVRAALDCPEVKAGRRARESAQASEAANVRPGQTRPAPPARAAPFGSLISPTGWSVEPEMALTHQMWVEPAL
jgi:hypothetical protein